MSEGNRHLPLYGPGPAYVASIVALTAAGIVLARLGVIPDARITAAAWPLRLAGALLAAGGIALWAAANFDARIDDGIISNTLVTSGVYAWVRNPIYTGFTFVCTGALLAFGNLWLLVLPFVFWALLTVVLKHTEERWLRDLYGSQYDNYCRRVNRCIPWPPRR